MTGIWPFYSADAGLHLLRTLEHGDLGGVHGHPAVAKFEEEFVRRLVPRHRAAFFNSGTSALCAGLFALKLPRGAEVIVPRRTFRSTVSPLLQFGLVPRFAECGSNGCILPASASTLVGGRTEAILFTHQWGQPADLSALIRLAHQHGLALIEDCSHAHGSHHDGRAVGTSGAFSFFSCGTTKLVSGGTGGMFVTDQPLLFERAIAFGQPKSRCASITSPAVRSLGRAGMGVNLRGSPFSATLAMDHLNAIDEHIVRKNINLEVVDAIVRTELPLLKPIARPAYWTRGTWYKRPFSVDADIADEVLAAAAQASVALASQDSPLDLLLRPVATEFGIDLPEVAPPVFDGSRLVVLNTLDMYSDRWSSELFRERIGTLRSRLSC